VGLAYKRAGEGPPLVLFHGIGHRRQAWDAVFDRLTPYRDVVAVDLPGHGESPAFDISHRTAIDGLAEETNGLLDELGFDRPHMAGNSLGGRIALEAAILGRAASVTALSPAGFWRSDRELAYITGIFKTMLALGPRIELVTPRLANRTAGRAILCSTIVSHPSRMSAEQALGDARAFAAAKPAINAILAEATTFTGLISGDVPVTIAWGDRDRLTRRRQALVARRFLPQARFVRLPGCGHVPMTDNPELVARILLEGSSHPEIPARPEHPAASQPLDAAQ
jgi:pimeloyl-ACP methyl ester carboxylesterase